MWHITTSAWESKGKLRNTLKTADLTVKKKKIKFGNRGPMNCTCMVLFMPDSLRSVWVVRCTSQKLGANYSVHSGNVWRLTIQIQFDVFSSTSVCHISSTGRAYVPYCLNRGLRVPKLDIFFFFILFRHSF